jgi:hypothetical protein
VEVGGDVGRMTLLLLLEKWFSIPDALRFGGLRQNLKELRIAGNRPIWSLSSYRDPATLEEKPGFTGYMATLFLVVSIMIRSWAR